MEEKEKDLQYAAILVHKIAELFDEDNDSEEHIDTEELEEGDNATEFFHALAAIMPTYFYNKFTGVNTNHLEFNHIANQLVFQHSKSVE